MSDERSSGGGRSFASPPCLAHEIDPAYGHPPSAGSQQTDDVARWRTAERRRLRAERSGLSVAARQEIATALARFLDAVVGKRLEGVAGRIISGYWPIKGEPDLRGWLTSVNAAGAVTALPVVEIKAAPLVFRPWTPETRMVRGDWNIPVPPPEAGFVTPEVSLAPLVGWDGAGYRLGYGGGYYDRTLAALSPRPLTIGVGLQAARLDTIRPQPHDIRLDVIVTEEGVQYSREG